jgi:hypothetical protein
LQITFGRDSLPNQPALPLIDAQHGSQLERL